MGKQQMHCVLISLAANCRHEKNLSEARIRLRQVLSALTYTPELWTDPVGGGDGKYLNQLAKGCTELDADTLQSALKQIEHDMGRTPEERQRGIVRIDLDLLDYDGCRHHLRDWGQPYVKELIGMDFIMEETARLKK